MLESITCRSGTPTATQGPTTSPAVDVTETAPSPEEPTETTDPEVEAWRAAASDACKAVEKPVKLGDQDLSQHFAETEQQIVEWRKAMSSLDTPPEFNADFRKVDGLFKKAEDAAHEATEAALTLENTVFASEAAANEAVDRQATTAEKQADTLVKALNALPRLLYQGGLRVLRRVADCTP